MHKLIFRNDKANTLSKMLEWANNHPRRIPYTKTTTNKKGLWLVKDDGIYLMSPTDDNFVNSNGDKNTVVYAQGYKPTKKNRDYLWDKTYAVSRDDFAEFIPLSAPMIARVNQGHPIRINLSATTFDVGV